GGQGEREPMPHVPDTGPGKRVTGAGARTEGREASRQTSEVGAVCGKAARTVLCGGRPVMGVPTAIASGDTPQRPRGEAASHREPVATSERSSLRATLMMALSVSFSRNWRERWTDPRTGKGAYRGMVTGPGRERPMNDSRCARRSWRDPAGESPAQVRGSARLVTSVASGKVTTTTKRTQ